MQIFKTYFRLLNQSKGPVIIYLCIFLGVASIVAKTSSAESTTDTYTAVKMEVSVIDHDESTLSSGIKNYMDENQNLVEIGDSEEEIADALYWRDTRYIITVPEGFEESVKNGESMNLQVRKMEESAQAALLDQSLHSYLSVINNYLSLDYSVEDALKLANENLKHNVDVSIARIDDQESQGKDETYFFFQYVAFAFLSITIMSFAIVMMMFNEENVKRRAVCSATTLKEQNIQINLANLVFIIGLIVITFLLIVILTGGKALQQVQTVFYVGNMIAFALVSVTIAFMAGTLLKTQNAITGANNIVGLGCCFLGGIFVPLEVLPKQVVDVAHFLPTYWYTQADDCIAAMTTVTDSFVSQYMSYIGIEVLFAVVFLSIGLLCSKRSMVVA